MISGVLENRISYVLLNCSKWNLKHMFTLSFSVVYTDPEGSGTFAWIRIRNYCSESFLVSICLFVCDIQPFLMVGTRYPASYSCPVSGRNWDMQEAGFFGTFLTTCTGYLYCRLQYFNSFAIVFRFWTLCNIFILAALCTGEQHLCKDRELRKLFPSCQGSRVKLFFMSANCDQKFALGS